MSKHHWLIITLIGVTTITACRMISIGSGNTDLSNGLIAWYPFDNNLRDSSGYGQHGNAPDHIPAFTSGRIGNALYLDGKTNIITAPIDDAVSSTGAVSISVYFKTSSTNIQNLVCRRKKFECVHPEDFGGLAWSVNASSQREPHFAVVSPEDITCETPRGIDAYTDVVYGMYKIQTGNWYHLVCVFKDGLQRIYINGKLRQSLSRSFIKLRECPGNMYVIGGFVNELPTRFNGSIDDLRIYNRLLTEEEITVLAEGFPEIDN
jgi:hypothetical protein